MELDEKHQLPRASLWTLLKRRVNSEISNLLASILSSSEARTLVGSVAASILFLVAPFKKVEVGYIHADSVGGLISQTDLILAILRRSDDRKKYPIRFIFVPQGFSNSMVATQYLALLEEIPGVRVVSGNGSLMNYVLRTTAKGVEHVAHRYPRMRKVYCGSPTWEGLDATGFVEDGRPNVIVTEDTRREGLRRLAEAGIDVQKPIICFSGRDHVYWESRSRWNPRSDGGGKSQDFRNVSLDNYLPMLRVLVDSGFEVVRMGAGATDNDEIVNVGVKDYANSSIRSESLDLVLFSECYGAILGGASGIAEFALTFHKPVCVLDYRPFFFTEWSTQICHLTPSLLREVKSKRVLPLSEMFEHAYHVGSLYEDAGLEFVPNSADEIKDSVLEFLSFVEGEKQNQIESSMQKTFWDIVFSERPTTTLYYRKDGGVIPRHLCFNPADLGWTPRRSLVSESFLMRHNLELFDVGNT